MTSELQAELRVLDERERQGEVLTGGEKGRLADLRRAEILDTVAGVLPPVNPVTAGAEVR
jgi:hypothetical protein